MKDELALGMLKVFSTAKLGVFDRLKSNCCWELFRENDTFLFVIQDNFYSSNITSSPVICVLRD